MSQLQNRQGRVGKEKLDRLNSNNPIQGNRFEVLSQSPSGAGGRNFVQQKLTAFAVKRSCGEMDGAGIDIAPSPKRTAPGGTSYARMAAVGEGGASAVQSVTIDKSWSNPTENVSYVGNSSINSSSNGGIPTECDVNLGLCEEMAVLSELIEKDGSPINMALLLFLNKMNEELERKNKRIRALENEVKGIREKCREKELFVNKAKGGTEKRNGKLVKNCSDC